MFSFKVPLVVVGIGWGSIPTVLSVAGFLLVICMASASSFANIWAEYVYKKDDDEEFSAGSCLT